jgi:hypothetical protein
MDRNDCLGLLLVIAAACTSMIVFSAIAMCWEPHADVRFRRSAIKHNCLIDRLNVSMTGRFPSTVNGTTIRTSPVRAIVRAFLFPKFPSAVVNVLALGRFVQTHRMAIL